MKHNILSVCIALGLGLAALPALAADDDSPAKVTPAGAVSGDDRGKSADDASGADDHAKAGKDGSGADDHGKGGTPPPAGGSPTPPPAGGGSTAGSGGGTPSTSGGGTPATAGGGPGPKTSAGSEHVFPPLPAPAAATVDFGSVQTGSGSLAQILTVSNGGAGPVTYTGYTLSGPASSSFLVTPRAGGGLPACAPGTAMPAGAACALSVTFQPNGVGSKSAVLTPTLVATANAGAAVAGVSPGARLAGVGVLPSASPSVGGLSFNVAGAGNDAAPQFLVISNSGVGPVQVNAATVVGTDTRFGQFNFAQQAQGSTPACRFGQALAVGASCSLRIGYHARTIGTANGTLQLELAGGANPLKITLSAKTVVTTPPGQHR